MHKIILGQCKKKPKLFITLVNIFSTITFLGNGHTFLGYFHADFERQDRSTVSHQAFLLYTRPIFIATDQSIISIIYNEMHEDENEVFPIVSHFTCTGSLFSFKIV